VRLPAPPVLLVTDRRQAQRPLGEVVAAALAAGCRWVSLREKDLPVVEQLALARALLRITQGWGARLTIHGTVDLAQTCAADGVHLSAGGDPSASRAVLGERALVGVSIHSVVEAKAIDAIALDYAVAGPAFVTASKPGYGPALGCGGLAAIVRASSVPVIAIGGIDAAKVVETRAAGAAGIAVMGGIMRAVDPGREMRDLLDAVTR
jgi:thiamine-phosphate pyrophosphorylase